jgi:hypothetical protein
VEEYFKKKVQSQGIALRHGRDALSLLQEDLRIE